MGVQVGGGVSAAGYPDSGEVASGVGTAGAVAELVEVAVGCKAVGVDDRLAVLTATVFERVGVVELAGRKVPVAAEGGVRVANSGVRRVAKAAVHSGGSVGKGAVTAGPAVGTTVETGVGGRKRAGTNCGKAKIRP
jgi:hypothetical protein